MAPTFKAPVVTKHASNVRIVDGRELVYVTRGGERHTLALDSLRVIAEVVSPGPFASSDDYFLVLIGERGEPTLWIPYDTAGADEVISTLGRRVRAPLETGLANVVEFTSRVMWPESLLDQPLYEPAPKQQRRGGLAQRLLAWWPRGTPMQFTANVLSAVGGRASP